MKPPSIYDFPLWDGTAPTYLVFDGTASAIVRPIVYIGNNELRLVAHVTTRNVFAYKDGDIIEMPIEGTWIAAAQSIIDQTGLDLQAGTVVDRSGFNIEDLKYRLEPL